MGKKQCPRCGAVQNSWNWYCQECRQSFIPSKLEYIVPYDQATRERVHRGYVMKKWGMALGAAALLLIVLMFLPLCSSNLTVTVHSTHLTQTVHYQILVNGQLKEEGDITAGNTIHWTIPYQYPWAFSGQQSIEIKGTGIGGGLGDTSDSHSLVVMDGKTYSITLNV